jgi:hypothetical protein
MILRQLVQQRGELADVRSIHEAEQPQLQPTRLQSEHAQDIHRHARTPFQQRIEVLAVEDHRLGGIGGGGLVAIEHGLRAGGVGVGAELEAEQSAFAQVTKDDAPAVLGEVSQFHASGKDDVDGGFLGALEVEDLALFPMADVRIARDRELGDFTRSLENLQIGEVPEAEHGLSGR